MKKTTINKFLKGKDITWEFFKNCLCSITDISELDDWRDEDYSRWCIWVLDDGTAITMHYED